MQPIELRGFRINGSITQPISEGDWTIATSTTLFDQPIVAPNDSNWSNSLSRVIPFNEADSLAAATQLLQNLVDELYDSVPTP